MIMHGSVLDSNLVATLVGAFIAIAFSTLVILIRIAMRFARIEERIATLVAEVHAVSVNPDLVRWSQIAAMQQQGIIPVIRKDG